MWIAAGAVFLLYAGSLSYAAGRDFKILQSKTVQLLAIGLFFTLFAMTMGFVQVAHGKQGLIFCFPIILIGIAAAYRFFPYVVGEWFQSGARAVIGLDQMTVRRSYDLAEKAEKDREWGRAVDLYYEETRRDADDPEPWRRIAELEVKRGRLEESLTAFRQAARLMKQVEDHVTVKFRLSDVLMKLGRVEEARRVLEEVARERRGTKFEEFAQERLKSCR